jgi:type VI secretion system protein ImpA
MEAERALMVDFEKLLAPISDTEPAGPDLRATAEDNTFRTIDELRREVDPALDDAGGKVANWPAVRRACEQALANSSKDLRLAGWLCESLGRTEGFAGLLDGLRLVRQLLDRHWESVHPQGDADGDAVTYARRAAALNWLAAARGLLPSVRAIGLLGEGDRREEWLPWAAFLEAQRVDEAATSSAARFEELKAAGAVTSERWQAAAAVTPPARLRAEHGYATECLQEIRALESFCEERFPRDDAPSLLELRSLISDVAEWLATRLPSEGDAKPVSADAPARAGLATAGAAALSGPIGTRAEALARLSEVAAFFRQTEPHSPVSRLIERAVRWGNMSFEELLLDVVKNNDALTQIWETLGVKPPASPES